jgi:hypothetical protein
MKDNTNPSSGGTLQQKQGKNKKFYERKRLL